jgi:hypothetical protein
LPTDAATPDLVIFWLVVAGAGHARVPGARRNRPDDLPAGHGLRSHGADPARQEAWIAEHRRLFDRSLLEKIVLVGFVCALFAQIIPGVDRTSVQIFVGAAVLIVIDSLLGLRTARRSGGASPIVWSFVWLAVANEAIVALGRLTQGDEQLALGNTIFFVGLLTLIVTLYDRYEPYRGVRFEESPQGAWV